MATPESAWCPPLPALFVPTTAGPVAFLRISAQPRPVPGLPVGRVEFPTQTKPQP